MSNCFCFQGIAVTNHNVTLWLQGAKNVDKQIDRHAGKVCLTDTYWTNKRIMLPLVKSWVSSQWHCWKNKHVLGGNHEEEFFNISNLNSKKAKQPTSRYSAVSGHMLVMMIFNKAGGGFFSFFLKCALLLHNPSSWNKLERILIKIDLSLRHLQMFQRMPFRDVYRWAKWSCL